MIFDQSCSIDTYKGLTTNIDKAIAFLNKINWNDFEDGESKIAGKDVYANVQTYQTEPANSKKFETHRRYIDLQYVISGEENIFVTHVNNLVSGNGYNPDGDFEFHECAIPGTGLLMTAGSFALLYPQDAHKPGCSVNTASSTVRKCVIKIAVV